MMGSKNAHIDEIFLSYATSKGTDYALMLNGGWGIGKTYYIQKQLRPLIEATVTSDGENLRLIHVSLNGIQSTEEIQGLLIDAFLSLSTGQKAAFSMAHKALLAGLRVPMVSQIIGKGEWANDLRKDIEKVSADFLTLKACVLVFDDLERTAGVDIKAVLGHLTRSFVERKNAKCILVCNEEELIGRDDEYERIKEKLVGRIVDYQFDAREVYYSLKSRYLADDRIFNVDLDPFDNRIITLVEKLKIKNVRTIRFILDVMRQVWTVFREVSKDTEIPQSALWPITFLIFALSIEFKRGALNSSHSEDFRGLETVRRDHVQRWLAESIDPNSETDPDHPNNDPDYGSEFFKRYLEDTPQENEFIFLPSVFHLVVSGWLDEKLVTRDLSKFLPRPPFEDDYASFLGFHVLDDADFIALATRVLGYVEQGKYKPVQYADLFYRFEEFSNIGLLSNAEADLSEIFHRGLEASFESGSPAGRPRMQFLPEGAQISPVLKVLVESIVALSDRQLRDREAQRLQAFVESLEGDIDTMAKAYREIAGEKIFAMVSAEEVFKIVTGLSNAGLSNFAAVLGDRYVSISNAVDFYATEMPNLRLLKQKLDDYCAQNQTPMKLRVYNIQEIAKTLGRIVGAKSSGRSRALANLKSSVDTEAP